MFGTLISVRWCFDDENRGIFDADFEPSPYDIGSRGQCSVNPCTFVRDIVKAMVSPHAFRN